MHGINAIRITGRILNKSIPIGADIGLVRVMTRIFIISTIAARVEAGIKDSKASVRQQLLLVMASVLLEPVLVMTSVPLQPLVGTIEPLVVLARKPR
jgi:hypothetical protein